LAIHPLELVAPPERARADARRPAVARGCPLCTSTASVPILEIPLARGPAAGLYTLRRCLACDLVFTDPRPADEVLSGLYAEEFYFSTGWPFRGLAEFVLHGIQRTRQRRVQRYVRRGSLLDVGSGDGRFVRHMAAEGWQATGLDFSPAAHAIASSLPGDGRFLCGSLFDHDLEPGSLDVITLWQVLEHIGEPSEFLGRCHVLMRPGGLFAAAVPNLDGLSARLGGDRWWGLDVPRHLVHYTPSTLCAGLEQAGFRIARVNHLSLQYDPYALLHSTLDRVFTRRHFLSDLVKRQLPGDLHPLETAWNLAALAAIGPVLAPCCVLAAAAGACAGRGGFIEVFARRGW